MSMLSDWDGYGGFCVVFWVIDSPTLPAFVARVFVFMTLGVFICTALNIAWLVSLPFRVRRLR